MTTPEGKLVFTLPKEKRPKTHKVYGRKMGKREPQPVCSVSMNGEVRMFDGATIVEVMVVLSCEPYELTLEELRGVGNQA